MPLDEVHAVDAMANCCGGCGAAMPRRFAALMRRTIGGSIASRAASCGTRATPRRRCRRAMSAPSPHLDDFKGEASLASWLARIVTNEAFGSLRRRRPERRYRRDVAESACFRFARWRRPIAERSSPEHAAARAARSGVLSRARSTRFRRRSASFSCCARWSSSAPENRRQPRHPRGDRQDALSPRKPAVARRPERAISRRSGTTPSLRRRALRPACGRRFWHG